MLRALTMYEMTGEARFLEVFASTWRLVTEKLVDGRTGEWHARIAPDGTPGGEQGTELEGRVPQRPRDDQDGSVNSRARASALVPSSKLTTTTSQISSLGGGSGW